MAKDDKSNTAVAEPEGRELTLDGTDPDGRSVEVEEPVVEPEVEAAPEAEPDPEPEADDSDAVPSIIEELLPEYAEKGEDGVPIWFTMSDAARQAAVAVVRRTLDLGEKTPDPDSEPEGSSNPSEQTTEPPNQERRPVQRSIPAPDEAKVRAIVSRFFDSEDADEKPMADAFKDMLLGGYDALSKSRELAKLVSDALTGQDKRLDELVNAREVERALNAFERDIAAMNLSQIEYTALADEAVKNVQTGRSRSVKDGLALALIDKQYGGAASKAAAKQQKDKAAKIAASLATNRRRSRSPRSAMRLGDTTKPSDVLRALADAAGGR